MQTCIRTLWHDRTVTTDNKDDVKVETPTDDKTDSDTSKDNATVETPN